MEESNAIIESTMLGIEDHGIMTLFLYLNYGGRGQEFGGYALGGNFTHTLIERILEVVGVDKWEDLSGKYIRAKHSYNKVHSIGNILKDEWLNIETLAQSFKDGGIRNE